MCKDTADSDSDYSDSDSPLAKRAAESAEILKSLDLKMKVHRSSANFNFWIGILGLMVRS